MTGFRHLLSELSASLPGRLKPEKHGTVSGRCAGLWMFLTAGRAFCMLVMVKHAMLPARLWLG